jgi:hypothetical protein
MSSVTSKTAVVTALFPTRRQPRASPIVGLTSAANASSTRNLADDGPCGAIAARRPRPWREDPVRAVDHRVLRGRSDPRLGQVLARCLKVAAQPSIVQERFARNPSPP